MNCSDNMVIIFKVRHIWREQAILVSITPSCWGNFHETKNAGLRVKLIKNPIREALGLRVSKSAGSGGRAAIWTERWR